ncbi:MAG: hypothetical protein AAF441_25360 [Pseudomonadota bacterium]
MNRLVVVSAIFGMIIVFLQVTAARADKISEASGIIRVGDKLLIVGDDHHGIIFHVKPGDLSRTVIRLKKGQSKARKLNSSRRFARDLESIGKLPDGRIVVLSEHTSALIDDKGKLVAIYDGPFYSFGNRGLEGLAIRELAQARARVAVLWEGGFPQQRKLFWDLHGVFGGKVKLEPVILVHDLKKDAKNVEIRARMGTEPEVTLKPGKVNAELIKLATPVIPALDAVGTGLRAPDLVWHKLKTDQDRKWGFIVLLSHYDPGDKNLNFKLLHKFDTDGRACGTPQGLNELIEAASLAATPDDGKANVKWNWEGMDWFDRARKTKLIMVADRPKGKAAKAVVIKPARAWLDELC